MKKILLLVMIGLFWQCKKDQIKLPFYNSAEWESEWIDKGTEEYKNIHKISEFTFTDQNNQKVSNANFDGRIYVANFFFTTCPGICPLMTENMLLIQEKFKDNLAFKFISHSVTPWIDTVKQLKKYATVNKVNDKQWHLVTGEKEDIYSLARNAYFIEGQMGLQLSEDDFLHTENFILVDKERRIRGIYNGTKENDVERLQADMLILLNAKS